MIDDDDDDNDRSERIRRRRRRRRSGRVTLLYPQRQKGDRAKSRVLVVYKLVKRREEGDEGRIPISGCKSIGRCKSHTHNRAEQSRAVRGRKGMDIDET